MLRIFLLSPWWIRVYIVYLVSCENIIHRALRKCQDFQSRTVLLFCSRIFKCTIHLFCGTCTRISSRQATMLPARLSLNCSAIQVPGTTTTRKLKAISRTYIPDDYTPTNLPDACGPNPPRRPGHILNFPRATSLTSPAPHP